ncbi:MAG: hypothetical protein IJA07_03220 [Agathobacter sp.]|nr:hypothetical protein [Agathobacter sp.]
MGKKPAEDYLDKLLNSVNDEKVRKEKFKETAKILNDAMSFWDLDEGDLDFQDVSQMQPVQKAPVKSQQEDILDALLSSAQNTEFGMNKRKPDTSPMYSRRVSKSEADFLREFEAELAGGDDDFADLFASFDVEETVEQKIKPEDRLEVEDIHVANVTYEDKEADGFILGDVDLASLVNEAANVMSGVSEEVVPEQSVLVEEDSMEENPIDEVPLDEMPVDVFADLFGGEESLDLVEQVPEQNDSEGIDLGNLGEDDLMNLLAGADDLADIGNMLSKSEATEIPLEELDAFTIFAENEMSAQQISAEPAVEDVSDEKKDKKDKKGGLIGKLKDILGNLMKDDEDDDIALKPAKNPTAETLSGENADILAELDALEEKPSKKEK